MNVSSRHFLFFDLGNVIVNFDHEIGVRNLAELCHAPQDQVREFVFESELQSDYETGRITSQEFYQAFCKETSCTESIDNVLRAVSDVFCLNAEIVPLLTNLRQCGYRMGVLSNTCEAHWDFLRKKISILNHFFECFALSFEIGAAKPDPRIFAAAATLAKVDADAIFFTDDIAEHIAAAREFGWDAEPFISAEDLASHLAGRGIETNF